MPYKKYVNSNYIKAYGYIHTINVYRSNAENNKVYPRRLNGIKLGAFDVEIEPRKRKTILKKKDMFLASMLEEPITSLMINVKLYKTNIYDISIQAKAAIS